MRFRIGRWAFLVVLGVACAGRVRALEPGGVLNLNCVAALVAVDRASLAGVFSFIAENDSAAAFADLAARDPKVLKKYVAKLNKDLAVADGITPWDHEAVSAVLALLNGPLVEVMKKPSAKVMDRLKKLSEAPAVSLDVVTARRKK